MKKIIIILTLALAACNAKPVNNPVTAVVDSFPCVPDTIILKDTVFVGLADHIADSLSADNQKLARELLNARLVISNVKYYVNLAAKNPSQQKFLLGWLKRPLDM